MEGGVIGERVKLCEIAGVLCIGQNQLNIGNSVLYDLIRLYFVSMGFTIAGVGRRSLGCGE